MKKRIKKVLSMFMAVIMVLSITTYIPQMKVSAVSKVTLSDLMNKFPAGKYWNHMGSSTNNPDGYTSTPCTHHGNCSKNDTDYSGLCGCNSFGSSIQCFGFANKLAYDAYGSLYTSWGRTTLNNLKPGDVIRYKNNGHSIFVTNVSGDTITYGDCNSDNHCKIRWNATISKSTVASTLTAVYSAPSPLSTSGGNDVIWTVDNRYPAPITAYPIATSDKLTVYNSNLTAYSQSDAHIAYNDLCTINAVYTNGYCSVTYPTSSGSRTEYAKISDFITGNVTPYAWKSSQNISAYTRSDMSTVFGEVYTTDNCTAVGSSGSKLQIVYPLNAGGYKLGWVDTTEIPPSDYPTPLKGYNASADVRTTVYESLSTMGTYWGQIFVDDECTLNSVNISGGWIHVTYPASGTYKRGYVYLDQFIPNGTRLTHFYKTTVTQQSTTYRKADMATNYGWVSVGDEITVVGKSGNKLQILYPLDAQYGGGYKIAWMYDTYVKKNLSSISVTSVPTKTLYLEGESLNTNGLVVTAKYDDGSTANITGSCTFSGYDSTPGVKTVTVTYKEKQSAFTVRVNSKSLSELTIVSLPSKTIYEIGEYIDLSGLKVKVKFNNGTEATISDVNMLDAMYDESITETTGEKKIKISYAYNDMVVSDYIDITVKSLESPSTPTPDNNSPKFMVSDINAKAGSTVKVDIAIENNPGITAFNFSVDYPSEILTLKNVEYNTLFSSKATGSKTMSSPFIISWFSALSQDETENGVVATLTFKVKDDVQPGNYNINLNYDENNVFDSSFANIKFAVDNCDVVITDYIPGDVNGDSNVNMKDIVLLQQYLNDWNVEIDENAANVNGDSIINMKDIVLLQQYLNDWDVTFS